MNSLLGKFTKHNSLRTDKTDEKDGIIYEESFGVSFDDPSEDENYLISAFEMNDVEL